MKAQICFPVVKILSKQQFNLPMHLENCFSSNFIAVNNNTLPRHFVHLCCVAALSHYTKFSLRQSQLDSPPSPLGDCLLLLNMELKSSWGLSQLHSLIIYSHKQCIELIFLRPAFLGTLLKVMWRIFLQKLNLLCTSSYSFFSYFFGFGCKMASKVWQP